jgi:putative ABC transport system ATP-binding protein
MPRINATRAEYGKSRTRAARASAQRRAHYGQPGVWDAERAAQQADLDRATANDILRTLQLLNKELGKTIVMVTHDPEAARFATRTLHLDKGRFVEATA